MLTASGREDTQVGQTSFSFVYRVENSANFPCGGKAIVLYYINSVMLDMFFLNDADIHKCA